MESTPKSRSVGIAYFFKHSSVAIWLNSLEYQFRGHDICPFLEKSAENQPISQGSFISNFNSIGAFSIKPEVTS